jgi:hypothetical protein
MNIVVHAVFREINVGNAIGPAPLQQRCFDASIGPSGTAVQMITLQAIGNGGQSNP